MPVDMSAAVKAPPRRSIGRVQPAKATATVAETRSPFERRRDGLYDLGQLGQGLCLMTQQWADAAAVGQHWPNLATELAKVADSNEIIAKPIDFLIEIGPYGALIVAGMPLVLQIAANHKWIDATKMIGQGVVPPEVLEAQMKAQVAKMQADAMREQQMAMQEAAKAQAEYEEFMASNAPSPNGAA